MAVDGGRSNAFPPPVQAMADAVQVLAKLTSTAQTPLLAHLFFAFTLASAPILVPHGTPVAALAPLPRALAVGAVPDSGKLGQNAILHPLRLDVDTRLSGPT